RAAVAGVRRLAFDDEEALVLAAGEEAEPTGADQREPASAGRGGPGGAPRGGAVQELVPLRMAEVGDRAVVLTDLQLSCRVGVGVVDGHPVRRGGPVGEPRRLLRVAV